MEKSDIQNILESISEMEKDIGIFKQKFMNGLYSKVIDAKYTI